MYGQTAVIGQAVNTQVWVNKRYAGAAPGVIVSIDGDGRTQGTMTVRRQSGLVETVAAMIVSPRPVKKSTRRVRKGY